MDSLCKKCVEITTARCLTLLGQLWDLSLFSGHLKHFDDLIFAYT